MTWCDTCIFIILIYVTSVSLPSSWSLEVNLFVSVDVWRWPAGNLALHCVDINDVLSISRVSCYSIMLSLSIDHWSGNQYKLCQDFTGLLPTFKFVQNNIIENHLFPLVWLLVLNYNIAVLSWCDSEYIIYPGLVWGSVVVIKTSANCTQQTRQFNNEIVFWTR